MQRFLRRHWMAVLLITLAVVFVLQNADPVRVRFLVWELQTSRAIVLLLTLAAGWSAGWLLARRRRRLS